MTPMPLSRNPLAFSLGFAGGRRMLLLLLPSGGGSSGLAVACQRAGCGDIGGPRWRRIQKNKEGVTHLMASSVFDRTRKLDRL